MCTPMEKRAPAVPALAEHEREGEIHFFFFSFMI